MELFSSNHFRKQNEIRRECALPTPRESYILEAINSSKRLWIWDQAIKIDPIAEGQRLAHLLYKHASQMQTDREFFIKAYFPACFMLTNIDGKCKLDFRQMYLEPLLVTAATTFHELAKANGFWDEMMDDDMN